MKPETKFSAKVQVRLRQIPYTYVIRSQAGSIVGIPDLIICCNGKFFAWELKMDGNEPTKLQTYNIEKICEAKGMAWIVTPKTLETSINQLMLLAEVKHVL